MVIILGYKGISTGSSNPVPIREVVGGARHQDLDHVAVLWTLAENVKIGH